MKQVICSDDVYTLKVGDKFIFRGKSWTLASWANGTIYLDKESFEVFNSNGKLTKIFIPNK
jgi:hypothetical protein